MTQVTITKVYRSDKDKNGNVLMSKAGRPYTKLAIKTKEYGDRWLSGFDNKDTSSWNDGDTVELNIEEKGEYLNFNTKKSSGQDWGGVIEVIRLELSDLKKRVSNLESGDELNKI